MGTRKINIESSQELILKRMKEMLNESGRNDSLMLIRVRQDGNRVEASATNSVNPRHLIHLKTAFTDSFKNNFDTLMKRDPLAAIKIAMELSEEDAKKD